MRTRIGPLGTAAIGLLAFTQAGSVPAIAAEPMHFLFDQAQYWHQKGRNDLAVEALKRILSVEANQPDALYYLAIYSAQNGRMEDAKRWADRFAKVAHGDPRVAEVERAINFGSAGASQIAKARRLASHEDFDGAIRAYRQAFGNAAPPIDYAAEYYLTLAGTKWGWDQAAEGLGDLSRRHRADTQLRIAYGRVLTYRDATRRKGIQVLSDVDPSNLAAAAALHQALLWLDARPDDEGLYQSYLNNHPNDREVASRLDQLLNPLPGTRSARARQKGFEELKQGETSSAAGQFAKALRLNPEDADALGGSGLAALRAKRYSQAERQLSEAIKLAPQKASQWSSALATARFYAQYAEAQRAANAGNLEHAERLAHGLALSGYRDAKIAKVFYADVLSREGKLDQAEKVYREILKASPSNTEAATGLAQVLIRQGKNAAAEQLLAKLPSTSGGGSAAVDQTLANVGAARADQLAKAGDVAGAEREYEKAIAADPSNPWTRLAYARLLVKNGARRQAQGIMAPLEDKTQPSNGTLHALALFAEEMGNGTKAARFIDRVPKSDRTPAMKTLALKAEADGVIQSARGAAASGDTRFATTKLESIADSPSSSVAVRARVASTLYDIGQRKAAVALARREEARDNTGDPQDYSGFIEVLGRAGFDSEARTFLQQIAHQAAGPKAEKQLASMRAGLAAREADRLRLKGEFADAYDVLADALQDSPDNKSLLLALGRLYDSGKLSSQAARVYDALVKKYPDDPDVLAAAADDAVARNDLKRADNLVDAGLAASPRDPRFALVRGRIAESRGDRQDALEDYRMARKWHDEQVGIEIGASSEGNGVSSPTPRQNPFRHREASRGRARTDTLLASSYQPTRRVAASYNPTGAGISGSVVSSADEAPSQMAYASLAGPGSSPVPVYIPGRVVQASAEGDALSAQIDSHIARLEQETLPTAGAGATSHTRSGETGLSKLTEIDGEASYGFTPFGTGKLTASVKPVVIDAGTPSGSALPRFGTNALSATPVSPGGQQASGLALSLRYDMPDFSADVGTTPLGFRRATVVGGLDWKPRVGENTQLEFTLDRRAVTDSVLSYNGVKDPLSGRWWGNVLKSGGGLGFSYDDGNSGVYGYARYDSLRGENVESNSEIEADAGAYIRPYRTADSQVQIGFNADFSHFEHNLRYFTFGQGGYFSPQQFVSLSAPFSYKKVNGRWSYNLNLAPGIQYFHEDPTPYFPTDPRLQGALDAKAALDPTIDSVYAGMSKTGFGFEGSGEVGYAFTPQTKVSARLKFNNFGDYSDTTADISLTHTLGK